MSADKTTATDLAKLWQEAVAEYQETAHKKLDYLAGPWQSVEDIENRTTALMGKFKKFREGDPKMSRVRGLFMENMWLIRRTVNAVQVIGNTASAFPPAMPASLLFSVFGHVMESFANQSADYDKIIGFFEFKRRFLERLSIIEKNSPDEAPFQRCIVRVFASMLTICAVAQNFIEKERIKTWFNDLLRGSGDKNLAGAYSNMENAVNELSQAVGIATLKRVEILGDIVNSIDGKADLIIDYVKSMNENVTAIQQYNIAANAEQKIIGEGVQALQSVASRMLINEERIFGLLQLQKAKGGA